jgi:long-chain acyl-CoA synthetase
MYSVMLSGGSNVVIRAFSPEGVMQAIELYKVNEILLVPTMIQMLVDHPAISSHDMSSLRRIVFGASPMSEALLDRAVAVLPNARFVQAYGMTELSPVATILHHREQVGEGRKLGRHRSGGRATFGVEIRIVDADDKPVPSGTVGEICVRGDVVMMGYWERPEETAKAVVDGWMHTGDGGYMGADGFVYIVDRVKDMIISGGENVYSAEVENVVALCPAVAQCAVIGIPSERWGEAVHAVIVPKPGVTVDADELIAFCHERIAGYKCPRSVEVRDAPMPMSGAGKILKRELRRPFWEGKERRVN